MRKIATLNFEDGTGKTTTAVNLSHALAVTRRNVMNSIHQVNSNKDIPAIFRFLCLLRNQKSSLRSSNALR